MVSLECHSALEVSDDGRHRDVRGCAYHAASQEPAGTCSSHSFLAVGDQFRPCELGARPQRGDGHDLLTEAVIGNAGDGCFGSVPSA